MDVAKVERVIRDLVADYDRLDGFLSKSHVERLIDKRQLTVEECTEVYRQLNALGISIEDEQEDSCDTEELNSDTFNSFDASTDGSFEKIDLRLRSLSTKLLTAEEEVELGRRIELGHRALSELEEGVHRTKGHDSLIQRGRNAKDTMIVANLRLVLHIAKPYVGFSDLSLDDLFQEGVVGLMRAADKFDHTLGYKFSTYATWWIRQALTRSLANRGTTIRLPIHVHNDVLRLKRAYKLLGQAHPTQRTSMIELADELVWTIDKLHFIQQCAALLPVSLDEKSNAHDDLSLMDTLVSDYPSPEEYLEDACLAKCLGRSLNGLKERERKVLHLRFGLNDSGPGATLEEIGKMFGLTRERIRQIEARALSRLRESNQGDVLHDFLYS